MTAIMAAMNPPRDQPKIRTMLCSSEADQRPHNAAQKQLGARLLRGGHVRPDKIHRQRQQQPQQR